ncbi:MAG: DUF2975 domain-containing protein [Mucilaginibacter sp.]
MKLKWNSNLVINATVICSIILAAVLWFFSGLNEVTYTYSWYQNTHDRPSMIDQPIPDSVSYFRYLHMRDSIGMLRDLRNGDALLGSGIKAAYLIGTRSGIYCDTCRFTSWYVTHETVDEAHQRHYITLPGWGIHNNERDLNTNNYVDFYVKNGKNYLRQNDKDIPVKFVYSHIDQCIMIPVSEHTQKLVNILVWVFAIAFILYVLYLFACFINFLTSLSRGHAFTEGNLRRLSTIGISLLVIPLAILFLNLLLRLIFHSYFTSDVILNKDMWKEWWKNIAEGAVFLLIYKAFRQGKQLKDEQDLTV